MSSVNGQQVYDEIGKTLPFEIGFNRQLSGSVEGLRNSTPPPAQIIETSPPPSLRTSSLVPPKLMPERPLVTSATSQPINNYNQLIVQVKQEDEIEEIEVPKTYVKGYSAEEMNRKLFEILTSKSTNISCALECRDYYSASNPIDGEFRYKSDIEMVHQTERGWVSSNVFKIKYTRWGDENAKIKILLLHDLLDSRISWWCSQKLLSSFFDTLAVDLVGTGGSSMPRGINNPEGGENLAGPFPWSYAMHAEYLISMCQTMWPGEKFYIVGVDHGSQIAATMASVSDSVAGIIMISPPGFHSNSFPGTQYLDIYEMRKLTNDGMLENLPISFTARIRDLILSALTKTEDRTTNTTIKKVLEQYESTDRKRILIDQITFMAENPYQEFPVTEMNEDGLDVDDILVPCHIVVGSNDRVCNPEHKHLYPAVYYNSEVSILTLQNLGHLIHLESPRTISEVIINFIRSKEGYDSLNDSFMGFLGNNEGNEKEILDGLRKLYF